MMKKKWLSAVLVLALCLSGCIPQAELPKEPAALPTQNTASVPAAPLGNEAVHRQAQVQLWYPDESGGLLVYETQTISGENETRLCHIALEAMLSKGTARFPQDASLVQVEYMGDRLAIVEWTMGRTTDEKAILALLMSSANTLGSLGVQAVAFRINGRAAQLQSWPLGALLPGSGDLNAMWARLTLEREQNTCVRLAMIFRSAADGQYIAPELMEIQIHRNQEMTALLEALRSGNTLSGASAAFPKDPRALLQAPVWAGEGMVSLHFDANLLAMLEAEGIRSWQMYAATACTCLAFLGQVEGVKIYVSNAQVVRMDQNLTFEDGVMRWQDFRTVRAQAARVYLSNGMGRLTELTRFFPEQQACDPALLLETVMAGPMIWENDAYGVAPQTPEDGWLRGVCLEGQEARINLSFAFQEACGGLTAAQERSLIYAMVNTLCQLRNIEMVRFYVEGQTPETFVREISFLSPLRKNLGLVQDK